MSGVETKYGYRAEQPGWYNSNAMRQKQNASIHRPRAEELKFNVQPKPHSEQEENHVGDKARNDQSDFAGEHAFPKLLDWGRPFLNAFKFTILNLLILIEFVKNIAVMMEV